MIVIEAMIIFASVMIILVSATYIVKQMVIGVAYLIRSTTKDIFKDLDMDKKE